MNKTTEVKIAIVREYQGQANGFDDHYSTPLHHFTYSTGVKLVADTCGAHWLIDAIASHQPNGSGLRDQDFQAWFLAYSKPSDDWILRCEDGNENVLIEQEIEFSDFPKDLAEGHGFRLWLENNVLFLPEER